MFEMQMKFLLKTIGELYLPNQCFFKLNGKISGLNELREVGIMAKILLSNSFGC